jgi:hypothetical protein
VNYELWPFCDEIASGGPNDYTSEGNQLYGELFGVLRGTCQSQGTPGEKYPETSVDLMYNLAGQRGRVTIQTRYASLADYERIDAELDNDEEYSKLVKSIISATGDLPVDQFYRVIKSP